MISNYDKVIIIPDTHGRDFWRPVLNINFKESDHIIFLGDYSDPYLEEGFTHKNCINNLKLITKFKKDNPDKVTLLLGNHDMGYIHEKYMCSRHSWSFEREYEKFFIDQKDLFEPFKLIIHSDKYYLFSHAGISSKWIIQNKFEDNFSSKNVEEALQSIWETNQSVFMQYGYLRGGFGAGGPMWADLREHASKDAVPPFADTVQVFGHTQLRENAYYSKNFYCLDCRKIFILENNVIKEY